MIHHRAEESNMLIKWREGEQSRRFAGVFGAGIVRVALSTCWRASWSSGIRLHQRNQTFPLSFPDEPRARPADPTPAEESGDSSPMPECCTTSLCPSIPVLLACRPRSSDPEPWWSRSEPWIPSSRSWRKECYRVTRSGSRLVASCPLDSCWPPWSRQPFGRVYS